MNKIKNSLLRVDKYNIILCKYSEIRVDITKIIKYNKNIRDESPVSFIISFFIGEIVFT